MASKKFTYAERAERYAEEAAANKSGDFPVTVSQAYAKWMLYKEEYCYRPKKLNLVCELLENIPVDSTGKKLLQLQDWQCALLSWPLVFVDAKGNRVVNELNFIAPEGIRIRREAAALMLAELAVPFRYHGPKQSGQAPTMILAAPGASHVYSAFSDARYTILKKNPKFERELAINSNEQYIKSQKNGISIKQRTLWFRTLFAKSPVTFVYADLVGILSEDTPISIIRAHLKLCKANQLLVTAGFPGEKRPSALNPIRDEAKRWLSNKNELGGRVGLLYQAEEADLFEDFRVWKRVYPGYPEIRLKAIFEHALKEDLRNRELCERRMLAKMDSDKLIPPKKKKARPRKSHPPINTSLISCSPWNFQKAASRKVSHAESAEIYAKKCANREINVPEAVSAAYKKWLSYKKKCQFKEENLTRVCQLIETALQADKESSHLELSDGACALLSWPLAFTNSEGERLINELHVRARPKMDISVLMAGLMLATIDSPFRNSYEEGELHRPAPVILSLGDTYYLAQHLFAKMRLILKCNPEFEESCEITKKKRLVKSEISKGEIFPQTMRSKAFAYGHETAFFIDDFVLMRDAPRLKRIRTAITGNRDPNYLMVTSGKEVQPPLNAPDPVKAEIEIRNQEKTGYGRVDLIY